MKTKRIAEKSMDCMENLQSLSSTELTTIHGGASYWVYNISTHKWYFVIRKN